MTTYQQFRLPNNGAWGRRLGAALSVVLALTIAAAGAFLALGIAIVLMPVVLVLALVGYWQLRKFRSQLMRASAQAKARQADAQHPTITVDYTVVDGDERR